MAEAKCTNAQRNQIEQMVYSVYDAIDPTKTNSNHYKELFATMSNQQFYEFIKKRLPFRTHIKAFHQEPDMTKIFAAFRILKKPLIEKVNLNYKYKNEKGEAVQSKECLVGYINFKRMKQFVTKKNATALEISQRDMKTGLLLNEDKGGTTSDRELESLAVHNLDNSIWEFSTVKADAMRAKAETYNLISTNGIVHTDDVKVAKDDSIAKNLISAMLIGCNLYSNMVNEDYYTPMTMKDRSAANIKRNI